MRLRAIALLLAVCLPVLVAAGCGSSSSSSSASTGHKHHRVAKVVAVGAGAAVAHHIYKKHKAKKEAMSSGSTTLHAGEFCTKSKASLYKAHHFKCKHGHLVAA